MNFNELFYSYPKNSDSYFGKVNIELIDEYNGERTFEFISDKLGKELHHFKGSCMVARKILTRNNNIEFYPCWNLINFFIRKDSYFYNIYKEKHLKDCTLIDDIY